MNSALTCYARSNECARPNPGKTLTIWLAFAVAIAISQNAAAQIVLSWVPTDFDGDNAANTVAAGFSGSGFTVSANGTSVTHDSDPSFEIPIQYYPALEGGQPSAFIDSSPSHIAISTDRFDLTLKDHTAELLTMIAHEYWHARSAEIFKSEFAACNSQPDPTACKQGWKEWMECQGFAFGGGPPPEKPSGDGPTGNPCSEMVALLGSLQEICDILGNPDSGISAEERADYQDRVTTVCGRIANESPACGTPPDASGQGGTGKLAECDGVGGITGYPILPDDIPSLTPPDPCGCTP